MRRATLVLMVVAFDWHLVPLRAMCAKATLEQVFARERGRVCRTRDGPRSCSKWAQWREHRDDVHSRRNVKGTPATSTRSRMWGAYRRHGVYVQRGVAFHVGSSLLFVFAGGEPLQTNECMPTALLELEPATHWNGLRRSHGRRSANCRPRTWDRCPLCLTPHCPTARVFRRGLGEERSLKAAPACLARLAEDDDALSVLVVAILFLWDCWMLAGDGANGSIPVTRRMGSRMSSRPNAR
jgi:hypothetical protein